ncbi:hypothetical protein [uncultured Metabacillus sp.]|uniref:YqgU-like beta propeller domain-containing protein n=1 Tax=uncultured Metabacillus sp. TaxID=2860135 RepID=UPI0026239700|nr:hypothetical protein [uncultured Metabacillus sp.]
MRASKILFLLMFILLLGAGCNPSHQPEQNNELSPERELPQTSKNQSIEKEAKLPIELDESFFHSVADWKDDETILYITNHSGGSTVHTYNLITGKSSIFFETEAPIVQLQANSDQSLFLVHTSPTSYEAELIVLDSQAKVKFQTKIESYELQYTWNQMNHQELFVSSFNEDWTFQTYIMNVKEQSITANPIQIPFIQWLNNQEITYLKWDQESPALTAPLYAYNFETEEEALLSENVVANTNFENEISTIELVDDQGTAVVRFYDMENKKQVAEMSTRLVGLYSEWAIPYYDMNAKEDMFYMIEADETLTSFSLVAFDLQTEKKETLIDNLENFPLILSPNGKYALFGARYEHIIDIKNKAVKELIKLK